MYSSDMTRISALLVIDMQRVAFDDKITPSITNGEQLLERVALFVSLCRREGIRIVYIQTCGVSGQPYAKDVHGWEIHPQLTPHSSDRIIYKQHSSGFDDTDLEEILHCIGINSLITCGIWSEHCVTKTSLDAMRRGFEVFVAADAHGTVADSEDGSNAIIAQQNSKLSKNGISVLPISDLEKMFLIS